MPLSIFDDHKVKEHFDGSEWLLGGIMKQVNIYNFYQFGAILHPITELKAGKPFKEYFYALFMGRAWLESFVNGNLLPMTICNRSAQKVISGIDFLLPQGKDEKPRLGMDEEVNYGHLYTIIDGMKEFETVFGAELQNLATYFVSKKGIYETNDLIQNADEWFPASIRGRFTGQVIHDLKEAGKCLAFDLSTAAGFHIARAVEGVLLEYLKVLCSEQLECLKESDRNLGRYIKLARENDGNLKVCSSLDQFRELHRNPLIHPETILTIEEALTLHGIAQSAIMSIIIEMDKRNGPLLPLETTSVSSSGMINE